MRRHIVTCLLVFLAFGAGTAETFAAQEPEVKTVAPASSFLVLPIVYRTPETGWAAGVGGLVALRRSDAPREAHPSSILFAAVATERRQHSVSITPEFYLGGGASVLYGYFEYSKFPADFYGIGGNTPDGARENFTPRHISIEANWVWRIKAVAGLFAGIRYVGDFFRFDPFDPGGQLAREVVPGAGAGRTSGLGAMVRFDSRDSVFAPSSGSYHQLSAELNNSVLGSSFDYLKVKADLRSFFPLFGPSVLAVQGIMEAAVGTAPLLMLPKLGGDSMMRGYYKGRYRDNVLTAVQAEFRFPVWWRFGGVVFAAAGGVADSLGRINPAEFKLAWGWGLRFKISSGEGINLRMDIGYGKQGSGVYFTANEAF